MKRLLTVLVVATLMTVTATAPAAGATDDTAPVGAVADVTTDVDASAPSDYCRPEDDDQCDLDGELTTFVVESDATTDYCRPEDDGNCGLDAGVLMPTFESLDVSPQDYCRPEVDGNC